MRRSFATTWLGAALATVALGTAWGGELDYTIVMSGRPKGTLVVRDIAVGERQVQWSFDDRGRGPDLKTVRRVDAKGVPLEICVDGKDYRKAVIAERFKVEAGKATWRSDADEGQAAAGGFYLPSQSSEEDTAALARALLASGGQLDLLPAGHARIDRVLSRTFKAEGKRIRASLYTISGLDLGSASIWLDEDRELFAGGGSWLGTIRRGFESVQTEVMATQTSIHARENEARAKALAQKPKGPVAIRHAALFDPQTRALQPDTTVLVSGSRIVAVGPDQQIAIPQGARVIDAAGKTLLPGLWDMHVHLLDSGEGLTDLLAGVTTVRDLGNEAPRLEQIKGKYDRGELPGPHVLKALLIDGRGPLAAPLGVTADTPEEIRAAIAKAAQSGYAQIKLYSSLKPELVPVAVQAAHEHGLRISGHIPAGMSMRTAVEEGYDEVQHAYFWFLNFMPAEVQAKTNSPLRFSAVGEHGHELDLTSKPVQEFVQLLASHHTVLDPTLVAFEGMFVGEKGKDMPWMAPWASRMPVSALRGGRTGGRGTTPELKAAYTSSFENVKRMLKMLYDAGVPIVPGTDGSALEYSRELELYTEAGIPAKDVLYAATLGSARVMHQEDDAGSLSVGKRADLVLIQGNPLERIGDIRQTVLTMKDGVVFDANALAAAVGLAPASGDAATATAARPVFHYDLRATVHPKEGLLQSDVTITAPAGATVDETFVLSRRFKLKKVSVVGPATLDIGTVEKPQPHLHALHVRSNGGGSRPIQLHVRYEGPLATDEKTALPFTDLIELCAEQMWVPLESHINQPFTIDARISGIPEKMMTVSQGDVEHRGTQLHIRRDMPDVDFALVAGGDLKRLSDPGIETYTRHVDDALIKLFRQHAKGATGYFDSLLGSDRARPLRIVAVPRVESEHAYARIAYIVFAEARSTPSGSEPIPERRPAKYVAHEVAHLWWLRANAQSEDNWLNESLADYSALRYVESVFGVTERDAILTKYAADAAKPGSILGHGRPSRDAVYARGPLLLFALDGWIGRTKMDRYLRELARQPVLTTAIALRTLSEVAGPATAAEFEAKLRADAYEG